LIGSSTVGVGGLSVGVGGFGVGVGVRAAVSDGVFVCEMVSVEISVVGGTAFSEMGSATIVSISGLWEQAAIIQKIKHMRIKILVFI
jgi:hypothetical protein